MKVRSFRTPRPLWESIAQGRTVLRGFVYLASRYWMLLVGVASGAIVLSLLLFPYDPLLLARFHFLTRNEDLGAQRVASFFGTWGDYPTYNLPLALGLWLFGWGTKRRAWRRLAVICFLGATLAGGLTIASASPWADPGPMPTCQMDFTVSPPPSTAAFRAFLPVTPPLSSALRWRPG